MSHRSLKYMVLAAPLLLGACMEQYEAIPVNNIFPYGNERTAGSTYAYVLKSLLPEKELNLEPVSEPAAAAPEPAEVIEPAPAEPPQLQETKDILDDLDSGMEEEMDEIFEEEQRK